MTDTHLKIDQERQEQIREMNEFNKKQHSEQVKNQTLNKFNANKQSHLDKFQKYIDNKTKRDAIDMKNRVDRFSKHL